jgi:hypothetical protein
VPKVRHGPDTRTFPYGHVMTAFSRASVCWNGQPVQRRTQAYEIHEAALGLLGRGHVTVHDMLTRQPWPAAGPDCPFHDVQCLHPLRPVPGAARSADAARPVPPLGTAS